MMKTIYFKILIFILPLLPLLSYGQPGDIFNKPPPKGNWIQINQITSANNNFIDSLCVKTVEYNDSIVWRKSNPPDEDGTLTIFFSIKKGDTINIYLRTYRGKITLSLVNKGVLNDTLSSVFYIDCVPHLPGRYVFPLSRKKLKRYGFPYRSYDITPKSWYNCLVNPPCKKPALNSPQSGNLIIAYNTNFNTPLKNGQYISLNPKDTTSQKPYVIIPDILDSLVNENFHDWTKLSKPFRFLTYKIKVYTDRGIYKIHIKLHKGEFDYPFSQKALRHCYFTVLPPFNSGKVNGVEDRDVVEISNQLRANYYDFKGTCCRRLRYLVIRNNEVIEDWKKFKEK